MRSVPTGLIIGSALPKLSTRFRITSTACSSMLLLTSLSPATNRMRNEVPPLISRPSLIFLSGGQILMTLKATRSTTRIAAIVRFRRPRSVAKYQPNIISRPRPIKNLSAGLIFCSYQADSRHRSLLGRFCLHDIRYRRFFHFDLHVICNLYDYRRIFHIRNQTMNARGSDDAISCFERGNETRLLFLAPHLRPQHDVIHDDENEDEREDAEQSGADSGGNRSWCLGNKKSEHKMKFCVSGPRS